MKWNAYRTWCQKTGRRCLVAPCGIYRIGSKQYRDDGNLWVGKGSKAKKIGPYMVVERYDWCDVVVRYHERKNLQRFEALRWKLLQHIKKIISRNNAVRNELLSECAGTTAYSYYRNEWWRLTFEEQYGRTTYRKDRIKIADHEVLDQMAIMTRSDKELALADRYLRNNELLEKYWSKVREFEGCLLRLLRDAHPDRQHPWGSPPVEFVINERVYFMEDATLTKRQGTSWPSPMHQRINLDIEPVLV